VDDQEQGARLPAETSEYPNALKVSGQSRVTAIAGRIAHDIRRGVLPVLLAAGEDACAVAVRSIARAREYLSRDSPPKDIACQPEFRDTDHRRVLLALRIQETPPDEGATSACYDPSTAVNEIKVSANSRHAKIGSVISGRLRETGEAVMSALGNRAIASAVLATAHAAAFVAADAADAQLIAQPFYVGEGPEGATVVAFKLAVRWSDN
jgi:stage V sporulation protein SpoVS